MLQPPVFIQPWPNPEPSTPGGPPPSSSSSFYNEMHNICIVLHLLYLHTGKQQSGLLAFISHNDMKVYLHISFYTILLVFSLQTPMDAVETHWKRSDRRGSSVQSL